MPSLRSDFGSVLSNWDRKRGRGRKVVRREKNEGGGGGGGEEVGKM